MAVLVNQNQNFITQIENFRMENQMKRTTRQFIRGLRKTFRETDASGRQEIWDILTGLRGPDYNDNNYNDKRATTAVVRNEVLGIKNLAGILVDVFKDSDDRATHRVKSSFDSHRFKMHAQNAFKALGLKWNEVNE